LRARTDWPQEHHSDNLAQPRFQTGVFIHADRRLAADYPCQGNAPLTGVA
jgi:hypothetical protein